MECESVPDLGNKIPIETPNDQTTSDQPINVTQFPISPMQPPINLLHSQTNSSPPRTNPNNGNIENQPLPQTPLPPPPPSIPTPNPNKSPNPTAQLSRKRPRRFSPNTTENSNLDLNSPPPLFSHFNVHTMHDRNTAPVNASKYSSFCTRSTLTPLSFEALLDQEIQNTPTYPNPNPKIPPILNHTANVELQIPNLNPPPSTTPLPAPPPPPHNSLNDNINQPPPPCPINHILESEIRDTISIGECVGIGLSGFENLVAEAVNQSRVNNPSQ